MKCWPNLYDREEDRLIYPLHNDEDYHRLWRFDDER
jgi:hypothetical protein